MNFLCRVFVVLAVLLVVCLACESQDAGRFRVEFDWENGATPTLDEYGQLWAWGYVELRPDSNSEN